MKIQSTISSLLKHHSNDYLKLQVILSKSLSQRTIQTHTHTISNGYHLWNHARKKTYCYQAIFLLISLVFAMLTFLVYHSSMHVRIEFLDILLISSKYILLLLTSALSIWSLWICLAMNPFYEQTIKMESQAKLRINKLYKSLRGLSYFHQYAHYDAEERIDKALEDVRREELKLSSLKLERKSRFLHRAYLLEKLEEHLDSIVIEFRECLQTSHA